MMVPSLSSGLPSLVGCFRCPPPPTPPVVVATPPAVEQRAIAVVAAAAAAVGDDAGVRLRVILVLVSPAIPPPLTAVESVDCTHRATISPPSSRRRRTRPDARSALLGRGALAAGAAWGLQALSLREAEEEGGAWRRLRAAGGGWWQGGREGSGGGGGGVSLV
jgi:hypothetical protein